MQASFCLPSISKQPNNVVFFRISSIKFAESIFKGTINTFFFCLMCFRNDGIEAFQERIESVKENENKVTKIFANNKLILLCYGSTHFHLIYLLNIF